MAKTETQNSTVNETLEMAKVHIYSENCHEKHSSAITNAYAFFLGIFIVLFSFLIENTLPLYAFAIAAIVLLGGTVYERYLVEKTFGKDLKRISALIEMVKAGKTLPSLEELLKTRNKN